MPTMARFRIDIGFCIQNVHPLRLMHQAATADKAYLLPGERNYANLFHFWLYPSK